MTPFDSTQFLRSDASDSFSSGTLTFSSGTALSVASGAALSVAGSFTATSGISSGTILPLADDTYDLGSSSLRWRDLFLGPTSLHLIATAAETTTARDWKLAIQETDGVSEGNLRILEGTNEFLNITPTGNVGIGITDPLAKLQLATGTATTIGTIIKGSSSQSADLLQLKNSLDAILAKVDALGNIVSAGTLTGTQLISTIGTGTAPLTVASTTVVPNLNAASAQQPNPNLVLNSDFGRRNKWMTFMPETFTSGAGEPAGWTAQAGTLGTVASNILTAGSTGTWEAKAGLSTWRDARYSAQWKKVQSDASFPSWEVGKWVDSDNWVAAVYTSGQLRIYKRTTAGGTVQVGTGVAASLTDDNWHWLELEAQGTKYIAKIYSSGASPASKSSATLVTTKSEDVTDSAFTSGGYIVIGAGLVGGANNTVASQWGGLSTGDGGVYVEGWGPESVSVAFTSTLGGQAIGFDESADAGPIGKQWAIRVWNPAAGSRGMNFVFDNTPDGSVAPSAAYVASIYVKRISGTQFLLRGSSTLKNSAGTDVQSGAVMDIDTNTSTTAYTRLTSSMSGISTARRAGLIFQNNLGGASGSYEVLFSAAQFEQGSVVTPWRNAPADDGPIVWSLTNGPYGNGILTSSTTGVEADPRNLAINLFLPWDAGLGMEFSTNALATAALAVRYDALVDGLSIASNTTNGIISPQFDSGNWQAHSWRKSVGASAGKHRVTPRVWVSTSSVQLAPQSGNFETVFTIVATRGKFDLAEEYSVLDQSIEAGDVVRTVNGKSSIVNGSPTLVERTDRGYDPAVLGVVSSDPAIVLGSQVYLNQYKENGNLRPLALSGRVPVKVTNENGPIARGDFLTSSEKYPGYAMKATRAGRTIGVALESFGESCDKVSPCQGKVMTFVNLSWYDPDAYLTDTGEYVISRADQSADKVSPYPSTGEETASSGCDKVSPCQEPAANQPGGLSSSGSSVPPIYELRTQNSELITRIGAFNSLFVANLTVGSLDASQITVAGTNLEEGILAQVKTLLETMIHHVKAQALDVAGNLTAKTAEIAEAVVEKLTVGKLIVSGPAVGRITILAGESSVFVDYPGIKAGSKVFVTSEEPFPIGVVTKVGEGFTIKLNAPAPADLPVNYWVIN